jgi:hypothetical protein
LIALEEQNLSDFLEIRSYLTGELGAEELNTILMEARASAATAAARHLRRKNRQQQQQEKEHDSADDSDAHPPSIEALDSDCSDDSLTGKQATIQFPSHIVMKRISPLNFFYNRRSTCQGCHYGSPVSDLLWATQF